MGGNSFEALTRRFAAARTRREVLRLLGAGALGAVAGGGAGWFAPGAAAATCIVEYPPADLDDCPNKRPHPGNVRESNGCGAAGSDFRPPQGFGEVSFTAGCNEHDICYETCGNERIPCDVQFGDRLVDACIAKYSGSFLAETACINVAGAFQLAVLLGGGDAYEAGQKKDCECCHPIPQVYCGCNQTCYISVTQCLEECQTNLGCFTNICGPATAEQCP